MSVDAPPLKMGGPHGVVMFAIFFTGYTYFITCKCQSGHWNLLSLSFPNNAGDFVPDLSTVLILFIWFCLQCALYMSPLGGIQESGVLLPTGQQLMYNANALTVLFINISLLLSAKFLGYDVRNITGSLLKILTSAVIMCFLFSWFLYFRGYNAPPVDRNSNGWSGHVVYDWFMGRELNPRWFSIDIKYILFRSGIIGWILLNICNLIEYQTLNHTINMTLLVLNAIQLIYVVDYFVFERGVIVSRDIVSEGLGYNILIQFTMIPFCFSVQTRYIMTTNFGLTPTWLCIVFAVFVIGFYIYRASNSEKNDFRKDPTNPKLKHLKAISTSSGRKLLISGWWGMCRHPNYLGDLLISLSYSLCTGFGHLIPYMGTFFLVLLLLDRERQDSEDCKKKYGKDWDRYCSIVKYRIIPGIY